MTHRFPCASRVEGTLFSEIQAMIRKTTASACSRLLALGLVATLAAGCSAPSVQERVERADAAGDVVVAFRNEVAETDAAIARAIVEMDRIPGVIGLDARPALGRFATALDELDGRSEALPTSSGRMRSEVAGYLKRRDRDADVLSDPGLRERAANRSHEVNASMEKVETVLKEALPSLHEQRTQLRDVLTFLAGDLTPRGLDGVKAAQEKARAQGVEVRKLLVAVVEEAELAALQLSPARR
jgi:hypothetical protein